jgi:hypothetical protein
MRKVNTMMTDTQMRSQIQERINKIPKSKLRELDDYISKLEKKIDVTSKTLSFAGAWRDIDNSTFDMLTKDLISNRRKNRKRINDLALITNNESHFNRVAGLRIENWKTQAIE